MGGKSEADYKIVFIYPENPTFLVKRRSDFRPIFDTSCQMGRAAADERFRGGILVF